MNIFEEIFNEPRGIHNITCQCCCDTTIANYKKLLINKIIKRFDNIINGNGLTIPRIAVKVAIEELKSL